MVGVIFSVPKQASLALLRFGHSHSNFLLEEEVLPLTGVISVELVSKAVS